MLFYAWRGQARERVASHVIFPPVGLGSRQYRHGEHSGGAEEGWGRGGSASNERDAASFLAMDGVLREGKRLITLMDDALKNAFWVDCITHGIFT